MKKYRIKKGLTAEQLAKHASISESVAEQFIEKKTLIECSQPFYSKYVAWFICKSSNTHLNFKVGIPYSCLELVPAPKRKGANHPLTKIFMPDKIKRKSNISKKLTVETTTKEEDSTYDDL